MSNRSVSVVATVLGIAITLAFGAGIVRSVVAEPGPSMQSESLREAPVQTGAAPPSLTMEQVLGKLAAQGYSDVQEIEREHDAYEVKARGPDGQLVELHVSAATGEIMRSELEDR
jgi:Peptidase propeptide and YPEB domain